MEEPVLIWGDGCELPPPPQAVKHNPNNAVLSKLKSFISDTSLIVNALNWAFIENIIFDALIAPKVIFLPCETPMLS
jgi:hypothetical protein